MSARRTLAPRPRVTADLANSHLLGYLAIFGPIWPLLGPLRLHSCPAGAPRLAPAGAGRRAQYPAVGEFNPHARWE